MKHIRKRRNRFPCSFPISLTSHRREVTNRHQQRTLSPGRTPVTSCEAEWSLPFPRIFVKLFYIKKSHEAIHFVTLFSFLFVVDGVLVQLREVQKLAEGHVEGHGDLVERVDLGIFADPLNNAFDGGLFQPTECGQTVDGDALALAKLLNTQGVKLGILHKCHLPDEFTYE